MKQLTKFRLLACSVACLVMLVAGAALAQTDPSAPPANPNPAAVVTWCGFGYILLSSLVAALKPDNPMLPFTVPMGARVMIAAVGGIALTCLQAIVSGVPWVQAALGMFVAVIGVITKHAPTASASK